MKNIFVLIMIFVLSSFYIKAQDYKYFIVDTSLVGRVELKPLSNENRVYNEKGTYVYLKNGYEKYIVQALKILAAVIPVDIWNQIEVRDKEKLSFIVYFDKTGYVFKMDLMIPDDIFAHTTEEQWNEFCNQFKAVNVLKYVEVTDYDKKTFVHSMMSVRPYRYLKNNPEKFK